jgi:RNA polymerase sigma-70 factor (ECF subfamily)
MLVLDPDNNYRVLFDAIARGDEAAFKKLFDLQKAKVYSIALKWTKSRFAAEEITQDVFVSLWVSKSRLAAVKDPHGYFYTIVYNKVSRHLKREANQRRILKHWQVKDYTNETEEAVLAHGCEDIIHHAIDRLSPQKKRIYQLSREHGKTCHEIGEALQVSPHTVKSHLRKAIKFVRSYVKDNVPLISLFVLHFLS